jgi:DNA primase
MHRKNGNLSPIRIVITLLLQNPDLLDIFEQKKINLTEIELPGMDLLKEVLQIIEDSRPKSSAVLLEKFRGKSSEKVVNTLMNWSFILDQETGREFAGALDRLVESANEDVINQLIAKESVQGLTTDEKRRLFNLLKLKG